MKFKVFVDGQHGTTGLKIHELLEKRDEIELLEIDEKDKKNLEKRKELLNSADLVFLCLPDDAAIESVSLIENEKCKGNRCKYSTQNKSTSGFMEYLNLQANKEIKSKIQKEFVYLVVMHSGLNNIYETSF